LQEVHLELNASLDKHKQVYILLYVLDDILVLCLCGSRSLRLDACYPLKLDHALWLLIMCIYSTCGEFSFRIPGVLMRSGIKDLANVSDPC
jgi:hypothetical protein